MAAFDTPPSQPAGGATVACNLSGRLLVGQTTCMAGDFLDREDETQALERAWASSEAVLALVWGRRRTGKTRLLGRFVEGKRAVFYGATQQASRTELCGFGDAIRDALHPSGSD